jgi:hypothetical protein
MLRRGDAVSKDEDERLFADARVVGTGSNQRIVHPHLSGREAGYGRAYENVTFVLILLFMVCGFVGLIASVIGAEWLQWYALGLALMSFAVAMGFGSLYMTLTNKPIPWQVQNRHGIWYRSTDPLPVWTLTVVVVLFSAAIFAGGVWLICSQAFS